MFTEDMKAIVESSHLGFVATVCADGSPNLSPKGSIRVFGDSQLVFADIASPTTVENLRRDPRIEVNCVDFLRRRGYRFKGTAEVLDPGDGPAYTEIREWLLETHGPQVPAHHAIVVSVERALPVDSPAYTILGAREEDLVEAWTLKYTKGGAPTPTAGP